MVLDVQEALSNQLLSNVYYVLYCIINKFNHHNNPRRQVLLFIIIKARKYK